MLERFLFSIGQRPCLEEAELFGTILEPFYVQRTGNVVQSIFDFYFQVISDTAMAHLRDVFMDAFDENEDNKIEICEVSGFHCP